MSITADKYTMFANRLSKVFKHRSKWARKQHISCFRIYDLDMPEFPFCIDIYGAYLYVAEYRRNHTLSEEEHLNWLRLSKHTISEVLEIEHINIFVKERKVIDDRTNQYNKYNSTKKEMTISEGGHQFIINLQDYLDTGLFLDHRITRKIAAEKSKDKIALNLFAYTGSFSVYMAAAGATQVDTIDLSNTYIDWAKRNFEINKISLTPHRFLASDVLQWLPSAPDQSYDLIICDPPTFSNSKKMVGVLDTQRDHVFIINQCLRLLKPQGELIFSTNYTKFKLDENALNSEKIKDITKMTTPLDFEGKLDRWCYLISKGN